MMSNLHMSKDTTDAIQALIVRTVKIGFLPYLNGVHLCMEQAISAGNYTPESCTSTEGRVQLHNDLKKKKTKGFIRPSESAVSSWLHLTHSLTNAWKWFTSCLMSWGGTWCLKCNCFWQKCLIVLLFPLWICTQALFIEKKISWQIKTHSIKDRLSQFSQESWCSDLLLVLSKVIQITGLDLF